jgi:imidazolonepropionase-like amidohydrolase
VIPGLIDAHVHATLVPGQYLNDWDTETVDEHLHHHLRAYLAVGVTGVLDCASLGGDMARLRGQLDAGLAAPTVYWLGQPSAQPGSYAPAVIPDLVPQETPDQVRAHLHDQAQLGVVGNKVLWEEGMVRPIWPVPDGAWLDALVQGAAAEDLPLYVHAMSPQETLDALDALNPHAVLHGLYDADPDAVSALAAAGTYVVSTLHISAAGLVHWYPERVRDDPVAQLLTHPDEMANLLDPAMRDESSRRAAAMVAPRAPYALMKPLLRKPGPSEGLHAERIEAARMLHDAGVPLVMGSDAPGWPILLDNIPAWSTLQELGHLEDAGLTPEQVLIASTRLPAEMIGVDDQVGTLQVGKVADLVVLSADPLASTDAYREPRYVMHQGELRTPQEWLTP